MVKHFWKIGGVIGIALLGAMLHIFPVEAANNYSAQWVAQANKVDLRFGETKQVWVEIKNTGTTEWQNSGINAVKIATVRKRDRGSNLFNNGWLSNNRVVTTEQAIVAPGEVGKFTFNVTAGVNQTGNYREYFGLVKEGVAWFDNFEFYVEINVTPAKISGEVVAQPEPVTFKFGESKSIVVRVKNTGDTAWASIGNNAVKLGTAGPYDRTSLFYAPSWLSKNRIVSISNPVNPGEIGEFSFNIMAPKKTGKYTEKLGVVMEGVMWLTDVNVNLLIAVEPAIYAASFVQQSPSLILTPSGLSEVWVELMNKGNTVWKSTGDNAVKLGTAKPLDRKSVFYNSTWLSQNRAAKLDRDISPGEVGRFTFTIQAPDKIGNYKEYFRPVVEGVTWLDDLGIYWNITVNQELVLIKPIRVGLAPTETTTLTITSSNGMVIRRGGDGSLVARLANNQSAIINPTGSGYSINANGQNYTTGDYIKCIPLRESILTVNNDRISSTYNQFRGIIVLRKATESSRVWAINELELEDYLKGIAEVPQTWPLEARKAQIIAARTFAVRRINEPRASVFDLYSDTRDQMYYGYHYEIDKPGITEAAMATKGMIVTYQGQPALTYYHSDSGGHTANVQDVWGSNIPYLQGVVDPYAKPVTWDATLLQSYVQNRFDAQLSKIGAVGEVVVDITIDERDSSGRIKTITLVTSTGKKAAMGLSEFDYLTNSTQVKSMNFTVEKTGNPIAPDFVLRGLGNGHGIGLSQYSALGMANQGFSCDQILKYFYPGVEIAMS